MLYSAMDDATSFVVSRSEIEDEVRVNWWYRLFGHHWVELFV